VAILDRERRENGNGGQTFNRDIPEGDHSGPVICADEKRDL